MNKMEDIVLEIKSHTSTRSPQSIKILKITIKKVFLYLNLNFDELSERFYLNFIPYQISYESYNNMIKLVHPKHKCFINHICKYILLSTNIDYLKDREREESQQSDVNEYKIKKEREPEIISIEDLNTLYDNSTPKEKLILLLLMSTGIRVGGIANIFKIDYTNNTFTTLEKGNIEITYNIESYLIIDLMKQTRLFNKKITAQSIRDLLNRLKKRCGLENKKNIHPHAFRHTFARLLLTSGIPLTDISKLLNHKNTTTTEMIYLTETMRDKQTRIQTPFNKQKILIVPKIWEDLKNTSL